MYNFLLIKATEEMKERVRKLAVTDLEPSERIAELAESNQIELTEFSVSKLAYKLARRIYTKSNLMLHEENDWFIAFEP